MAPTAAAPSPQVQREAFDRMHAMLRGAQALMPALPLILTAALWPRLGGWLGVALPLWALRQLVVRRYPRGAELPRLRRWASEVAVVDLLGGLNWGLAGLSFLVPDSAPLQMLLITMIVGISVGSIFATAYWPRSLFAYSLPAVGLTAVGLALEGTAGSLGAAAALLVYLAILGKIMRQAHGTAMQAIALQFENLALVEELRAQKELAEQASLAKSRFLAAASHDLRQPLHALGLFVSALRERAAAPELQPLVSRIERSVGALEGLLNALLDVSRLDAGVVEPQVRAFPARELFGRLSAEFAPLAQAKGLAWRCQGPALALRTDPALLETILRNLMSNAIRYTRQGEVAVEWRAEGQDVVVTVWDTGIGIPAQHQDDVFREFFQLHNPERDREKGMGLGLAIVDRLTRLLGHPLALRSTPGEGTTFELRVPAASEPAATAAPTVERNDDGALRVLVIDDEAAVREAMTLLLEEWGYHVLAVESADTALAVLNQAPQAIVSDYRLRGEATGAEAIRRVQDAWGAAIPALLVTGDTAPERLQAAKDSGYPLLHKPVAPARLRSFLRRAAAQRETALSPPAAVPTAGRPAAPAPDCAHPGP